MHYNTARHQPLTLNYFRINREKLQVSYHICWKLVPRKVLHVFMVSVDYFSEFAPIHSLLKHPHFYHGVKF